MKKMSIIMIGLLLLTMSCFAQNALDNLKVHGFISQSFITSTSNAFLVPNSTKGSFELGEMGLVITTQATDKLRIGTQILGRQFGDINNNEIKLDWGFADYRFKDYLGLRVGKVKLPFGLYNEGRDTDILRPMAMLPQSIYDEQFRSYFLSYQGVGLYGNIPASAAGDLDYNGFIGTIDFNKDELLMKTTNGIAHYCTILGYLKGSNIPALINSYATTDVMAIKYKYASLSNGALTPDMISVTPTNTGSPYKESSGTVVRTQEYWGGTLLWNTMLSGLKLGGSYMHFKGNLIDDGGIFLEYDVIVPTGATTFKTYEETVKRSIKKTGGVPDRSCFSLEYTFGPATLAAEYCKTSFNIDIEDVNYFLRKDIYYYGMLSYSVLDNLTITGLYDYCEIDEIKPPTILSLPNLNQDWMREKTDIGLGVRYDINDKWTFKAEHHFVDGVFKSYGDVMNPDNNPWNTVESWEKDWSYSMAKMSFNF